MVRLLLRPSRPASSPDVIYGPSPPQAVPACIVAGRCLQQGRQDLNLQPAVLETAALPVELRPFAVGRPTCAYLPGLTRRARSPFGTRRTDGQRAAMGKPRGPSVHRRGSQILITRF